MNSYVFTSMLCAHQALVCYINSFIFKHLSLFGNMNMILAISNIAEIINNLARAGTTYFFKNKPNRTIFNLNIISAWIFILTTVLFMYALYDNFNLKLCAFSWILNRLSNSITASCRDCLLYRITHLYKISINIPIIKTIKSFGNLLNLLKMLLITTSFFWLPLIYLHFLIAIFFGFVNMIICMYLYYISNSMLPKAIDEASKQIQSDDNLLFNSLKVLIVTLLVNLVQVDDSIAYFKLSNNNLAFVLKHCVGQVGLGILYSLIFKNSKFILIACPLVNLLFHQLSLTQHNALACMIVGLQFTLKNTSYVLFAMILCKYNHLYPAICILVDAFGIAASNFIFLYINSYFGNSYAHYLFRNLGIISLIFSLAIYLFIATDVKTKDRSYDSFSTATR